MKTVTGTQHTPDYFIALEDRYGAHNYHPLPVVLERGEGVFVWDVTGKRYYDFLSGYSAVNQGHCHPRITAALVEQAQQLTLSSRAFYNNRLGEYEAFITRLFGYDKVLPMNTGVEAVETAIKLARKWGYEVKGVAPEQAVIVVCDGNFHGRTTTVISFSSDKEARKNFGPYTTGFVSIPFNDTVALSAALQNKNVVAFLAEPIQGEAGIIIPNDDYLVLAKQYCEAAQVLFIADEIQTGLGRTGKMLACDHYGVRPDMVLLGKALGGGMMPVSAVLADDAIMTLLHPGDHGSTFGGNPLACAIATESLNVITEEGLIENAYEMGMLLRKQLNNINSPLVETIRGKGLLNALVTKPELGDMAWKLCMKMRDNGLIAKPTHGNKIRFTPPLIITEEQVLECAGIIARSLKEMEG
jgi:ornithine--oxo-acid transaminase